jgi:hypothetical protein
MDDILTAYYFFVFHEVKIFPETRKIKKSKSRIHNRSPEFTKVISNSTKSIKYEFAVSLINLSVSGEK